MRVSLRWLAEWIPLPAPAEEIARRLTAAGLEVDAIETVGPDLSAVVVGEVRERLAHPNADRLSLCRVDLGGGEEPVSIVCGAPNVAAGQKVAVLRPGGRFPDGTRLKKARIRGVESEGMICSERELGLSDEHQGILVLDPRAPVGAPLSEVLEVGDTVLEVALTPNRGDCASMLGIAREVRAQFGGELRLPPAEPREGARPASAEVAIRIEDLEGCARYVARVVQGVRPGPSPQWLRDKLEAAGMRSIDVIVDVTNLVMLELGQPLHAFDLAKLRGRRICVRRALPDEKLVTLDGETRTLAADDLVIADAERAIALAGVMGGAETEVRADTRDVLIESAQFHPTRVRRTARRLGLQSESSYRFERGVDPAGVPRAADRAARLIAELAGGEVSSGAVEALGAPLPQTDVVRLDPALPNRLLGLELGPAQVGELLGRVGIAAEPGPEGELVCRVPSHRNDLALPVDLVEEVARVYGYDRIPTTMPVVTLAPVVLPARLRLLDAVRDSLCASGLSEVRIPPWMSSADLDTLRIPARDPRRRTVRLVNSIVEGMPLLATTRAAGLLRAVQRNLARQADRLALFETASLYLAREDPTRLPEEPPAVAGLLAHAPRARLWGGDPPIFYELKGVLERLLLDLGYPVAFRGGAVDPWLHPGAAVAVFAAGAQLGSLGELHPEVATAFGLELPCALFELRLDPLLERPAEPRELGEISDQPAVRRDCAILVDRDVPSAEVLDAVRGCAGALLVGLELFDRYTGEGVPAGKLGLAFRMVFQRTDRTLRDEEVQRVTDRVRATLVERFGAELR